MNYYVKWNGQQQKRFFSVQAALDWCYDMDNKFPSEHTYKCYYKDGTEEFVLNCG